MQSPSLRVDAEIMQKPWVFVSNILVMARNCSKLFWHTKNIYNTFFSYFYYSVLLDDH